MDHVIEAAKSDRASCRTCHKKIDQGELRFGEAVTNYFDPEGGITLKWHHLLCAAQSRSAKVQRALRAYEGEVPNRVAIEEALASKKGKAKGAKPGFPNDKPATNRRSK